VRKRLHSAVAGATLVLLLATGCQASPPELSPDDAKTFQSRVLAVTTAVSDGGYAAALEALQALETELDAAAAEGSVTFARHQRIKAALSVVRADVQAAIDAQAEPEPAPAPVEPAPPAEDEGEGEGEEVSPDTDTETDAEKKAREAEEKTREAEEKAAEEATKKAEETEKKAEEARKAAEDAKNRGNTGKGDDDDGDD
jgi:outer membrane biosynthesis protein TonB